MRIIILYIACGHKGSVINISNTEWQPNSVLGNHDPSRAFYCGFSFTPIIPIIKRIKLQYVYVENVYQLT